MLERCLELPEKCDETFFLWGPRQTGKSTLLRTYYPDARWIDLLKADEYRRYLSHPEYLRGEVLADPSVRFVVIDEIQKVPELLDEVHWLHEHQGIHFALCGSSARKIRRGGVNLLGGRAVRAVVNFLAKRGRLEPGSELFGKAFENWCFHELQAYNAYSESFADLAYWRLASGIEVDFVVNAMETAIEAKAVQGVRPDHLKGLRSLKKDHPDVRRRILVCLEDKPRQTEDGIEILPAGLV